MGSIPIEDSGFEASASSTEWARIGPSRNVQISRHTEDAQEGRQFLRLSAPAAQPVTTELFDDAPPVSVAHVDLDLGPVMGYVEDRKLATIVGSTTAGANGNVVRFIPASPTIEGLRKGLDAVLEGAISVVRAA